MSIYSTADALEDVYDKGFETLASFRNMTEELEDAIVDIRIALDGDSYMQMERDIIAAYEYHYDRLFEQERANFERHLVDPLLDLLR